MCTLQQLTRAVAAAALIAFAPVALLAQAREPLEPGTRVRIEARALADTLLIGNLAFLDRDTLALAPPGKGASMIRIPTSAIERIEVSRGRVSTVAIGAFLGIAVGASAGYALASRDTSCGYVCGAGQAIGGIGGAALGLLLGAGIGSEIKSGPERWTEYPLPTRVPAFP